jgi:hypothetical protein
MRWISSVSDVQSLRNLFRSTVSEGVPVYHHHYHKHQGLDPLIRSVSRVTTAPVLPLEILSWVGCPQDG